MKRTPLKRSRDPLRRTGLSPMSERRRDVNTARAKAQIAAWGPRPWTCALRRDVGKRMFVEMTRDAPEFVTIPPCLGRVNGHEILSRTRAGRTDANLLDTGGQLPCCDYHNGWLAAFAAVPGLVEHSWTERDSANVSEPTNGGIE
jgi:hypothetical protein